MSFSPISISRSKGLRPTFKKGGTNKLVSLNSGAVSTPVAGVKATRILTSDATAPSNNETVTIGGQVYTFKTTLTTTAGNVLIGASAAAALDNLKSAINGTAGGGTTYAAATPVNYYVTATTNTDTAQTVEAKVAGTVGNSVALLESSTHLSWASATLTGGVNGTPGFAGDILFDAANIYIATADLTTASLTGWRKVAHSAL